MKLKELLKKIDDILTDSESISEHVQKRKYRI